MSTVAPHIHVVSAIPALVEGAISHSIVARARQRAVIHVTVHDLRHWAGGRHRVIDDRPFGGGPGMVLTAPPIAACLDGILCQRPRPRLLMCDPAGRTLDQAWVRELAAVPALVILAGHYEGIDDRIRQLYEPELFSIGPYVLSGGELPAAVLIDAITRLQPGALQDPQSAINESFSDPHTVDHPAYTRPRTFRGLDVPADLLTGRHADVAAWRREQADER